MVRPADHVHDSPEAVACAGAAAGRCSRASSAPTATSCRCRAGEFVRTLRLLTFAGSHPHISDGTLLTPEQIVDTLLHGCCGRREGRH